MELKNTRYEISDIGVATVWFHRPDRANAWTGHLHREYRWIFSGDHNQLDWAVDDSAGPESADPPATFGAVRDP